MNMLEGFEKIPYLMIERFEIAAIMSIAETDNNDSPKHQKVINNT